MPTCRPRGSLALPLVLLLGAAPGCDQLADALEEKAQEVADEMSPPADGPLPAGPQLTEDEQLAAKLSLYIECTNRASERIRDSWERYDERVKEDGTPRKKTVKPFLYKIDSELTPCEDAVTKGPSTEPSMPEIEALMATYLEHAKAFAAATVTLDTYYEREDYEDDAWAKAKELAPGFRAAYEAWDAADRELDGLIEARKDVVDRNVLALVEERHGRDIEWHSRSYLLAAKAFVRCATRSYESPAKPSKAPRAEDEGCAEAFAALQQAETGFRRYYDANRTQADAVFWMSAFEGSVSDSFAEAKKVMRVLPKGASKGQPKATAEALATLVDEYDGLVSDSNNLRFER